MASEAQMKKLLTVLERIADSLETLAATVDEDEDLNVYVRGEINAPEDEEDED